MYFIASVYIMISTLALRLFSNVNLPHDLVDIDHVFMFLLAIIFYCERVRRIYWLHNVYLFSIYMFVSSKMSLKCL